MFWPEILAEFFALDLQEFNLIPGGLLFGGRAGGGLRGMPEAVAKVPLAVKPGIVGGGVQQPGFQLKVRQLGF